MGRRPVRLVHPLLRGRALPAHRHQLGGARAGPAELPVPPRGRAGGLPGARPASACCSWRKRSGRCGRGTSCTARPGTDHVFVGAGDAPCVLLLIGSRTPGAEVVYPRSELALRHGAGVEQETDSPGRGVRILSRRPRRCATARGGCRIPSRGGRIRTGDLSPPKRARCQASLRPVRAESRPLGCRLHGRGPAAPHPALRARCRRPARGRDRAAVRRDRRRAARGARGPQPVQRRGDRPPARGRRRPVPARGRHDGRLARAGGAGPRRRAGRLGAAPGLHGSRTAAPRPHRTPRARARGGVRPGPHPARTSAPIQDRRRTVCGSPARRGRTSRRSSACSRTATGRPVPRSSRRRPPMPFATASGPRGHPQHALAGGGRRGDREPDATRSPARSC